MSAQGKKDLLALLEKVEQENEVRPFFGSLSDIEVTAEEFVAVMQHAEALGVRQLHLHPENRSEIIRLAGFKRASAYSAVGAEFIRGHGEEDLFTIQLPDGGIVSHRHAVPVMGTWWVGSLDDEPPMPAMEYPEEKELFENALALMACYTIGGDVTPDVHLLVELLQVMEDLMWAVEEHKGSAFHDVVSGRTSDWRYMLTHAAGAQILPGKNIDAGGYYYQQHELPDGQVITLRKEVQGAGIWWVGGREAEPPRNN